MFRISKADDLIRPRRRSMKIRQFLVLVTLALVVGVGSYMGIAQQDRQVFVVQVPDRQRVQVDIILPYPAGQGPLAHYTEHLAWLNTMGRASRAADRHTNAWTSPQAIGYWLAGDAADLLDLLGKLSGVFDPIDLPQSFAAEERGIILREYEYRMSGNVDAQAATAMEAFLYAGNPVADSVIGTPAQIMSLDYTAAQALHAQTHRRENARLIVTGPVTDRQVRRALRDAGWPDTRTDGPVIAPASFDLAEPAVTQLRYPAPDAAPRLLWRRVVGLPAPVQFDLLEAQTALLTDILTSNLPGGLAGPLQFDAAMARNFDIQIWPIDTGHIEIGFRAAPDTNVSLTALQTAFEAVLANTAGTGIPPETHTRVQGRFDGYWPDWTDRTDTADWMVGYVTDRVGNLQDPLPVRGLKQLADRLSPDTTNMLLRQLATQGRSASAFIGPEDRFE
ncbi:MAG: insulinase family protein [Loktanella sp.]|nr:insulinase family protein [Loktanella sp.]